MTAYDRIDELVMVAADFPIKQLQEIELTEEFLYIDQLPQLLKLFGVKKTRWNLRSKIIGPDGTVIEIQDSEGKADDTLLISTPIERIPLGWIIPKIKEEEIKNLVYDLIPCKEGESYLNPSMWQRFEVENRGNTYSIFRLAPGEITETLNEVTESEDKNKISIYEGSLKINTKFYNPIFYYLNPFFINSRENLRNGRSNFFCISLDTTIGIVSNEPFLINFERGVVKAEGKKFLVIRAKSWKEIKPHLISWDLRNQVIKLDCRPPFKISLFKIEPTWALPFYISYNNGRLRLGLVNLSEDDMIFTFTIAGRMVYAKIIDPIGNETESLNVEFDRVKIPIRRAGIIFVELGIKRLLESFLKRKMID